LLIISSLLLLPLLTRANRAAKQIQCQNNLRGMFTALMSYGDAHNGELPKVEEDAPRNFAGMFVPVLYQDGLLNGVSMSCPANGGTPAQPVSVQELAELYQNNRPKYEQLTREVAGCYAYALGYRSDGRLYGLRRGTGQDDITPIVADRPPFDRQDDSMLLQANSPNHGGLGQNVLYLSGNVRWAVDRKAGPNDKDIYLNNKCELKPGLSPLDVVLASSGVRVEPEAPPEH
jgi:hypothetical protein